MKFKKIFWEEDYEGGETWTTCIGGIDSKYTAGFIVKEHDKFYIFLSFQVKSKLFDTLEGAKAWVEEQYKQFCDFIVEDEIDGF